MATPPKHMLVVDDDPVVCRMVAETFTQRGFHVQQAKDGVEALRIVDGSCGAIDIMLLDVVMPRMNGTELVNVILSCHPTIKIVFMSGYQDDVLAKYRIRESKMRFIKKPFSLPILVNTINEALH